MIQHCFGQSERSRLVEGLAAERRPMMMRRLVRWEGREALLLV